MYYIYTYITSIENSNCGPQVFTCIFNDYDKAMKVLMNQEKSICEEHHLQYEDMLDNRLKNYKQYTREGEVASSHYETDDGFFYHMDIRPLRFNCMEDMLEECQRELDREDGLTDPSIIRGISNVEKLMPKP